MDELRQQFLIESRDLIADAAHYFAALAQNPQATASLEGAFRAIHTLKGSVALFALLPAERVLHAAEDLMERARKGTSALDLHAIRVLVDCLDQIDRWIDDFERSDSLPDDAAATADRYLSALAGTDAAVAPHASRASAAHVDLWLDDLRTRDAAILASADQTLVAFRYEPDPDCFFRGDDPLATVRAVPDLLSLAVLPRGGHWPDAGSIDPTVCFSLLEGLSAAPLAAVRAAFRMMPDQVVFAQIARATVPPGHDPAPDDATGRRTLRVDPARIDALGDRLGELFVALHEGHALAEAAERFDRPLAARLRAHHANLARVAGNIHQGLGMVRSVPLDHGLRRLPRLVREIADSLGKLVEFTVVGQDIEVDRQVAEGLFEPLLHLVRNAIDHGIESPDERRSAGKPAIGRLTLGFHRDRESLVATLVDDGKGMDPAVIRQTARERGLSTPAAIAALDDAAALRLVFLPGFSTARTVTELSGRGVGLDAVQAAVTRLRGAIEIDSAPGRGTTFRMALPANALTTRLLVVESGGERYGVPLDQIVETVRLDRLKLIPIGTGMACVLRGKTVPVLDLSALLGGADDGTQRIAAPDSKLIVVRSAGETVALRVDAFCERIDALVRPPAGMLAMFSSLIGAVLTRDGAVLLVLDLPGLVA